jgi:amidase
VQAMHFILCSREAAEAHAANFPSHEDQYGPYLRDFLKMGREVTDGDYAKASRFRQDFSTRFNGLLSTIDALVCPSRAGGVFSISPEIQYGSMAEYNAAASQFRQSYKPELASNMLYTTPADLAGTPTLTLPSGFSADNLPLSIQFVGQRLSEPMLCRIGHAYEEATGSYQRHPSV